MHERCSRIGQPELRFQLLCDGFSISSSLCLLHDFADEGHDELRFPALAELVGDLGVGRDRVTTEGVDGFDREREERVLGEEGSDT